MTMRRMARAWLSAVAAGLALGIASQVAAGAWPQDPGATLLILKYEQEEGTAALSTVVPASPTLSIGTPGRASPVEPVRDQSLGLLVEHGFTPWITGVAHLSYTTGDDGFSRFSGIGPTSVGVRLNLWRKPGLSLALYGGGQEPGQGLDTAYGRARQGNGDIEGRILFGWSWGRRHYVEMQLAQVQRFGMPNELRLDATIARPAPFGCQWVLQSFSGKTEASGPSVWWIKQDTLIQRDLGPWTVQAGWRYTPAGARVPFTTGPVVALWRRM